MNFVVNHAPGAGSMTIAEPVDQQSSTLPLEIGGLTGLNGDRLR